MAGLEAVLAATEIDMPLFFRRLGEVDTASFAVEPAIATLADAFYAPPDAQARQSLGDWLGRWASRVGPDPGRRQRMHAINPLYLPRNALLQEVIDATAAGDRHQLPELLEVLRQPYTEQAGRERYAARRPEWARHRAGCSTLSCSS
jgi:uncharacterized protein YdiU (UPF0061 family)